MEIFALSDQQTDNQLRNLFRTAIFSCAGVLVHACAAYPQYAAHGYLSPGPTGEPELIGIYDSMGACQAAADAWASRQVVGNPVYSECLPIDRN